MTELAKQKLRAQMISDGFGEEAIQNSIKIKERNEALLKYRKKAIKENELLKFVDGKCDLVCEDDNAIVYEFYGKRKNYEFTYCKYEKNISMRWCWESDEYQDFGSVDSKAITKKSQLSMLK